MDNFRALLSSRFKQGVVWNLGSIAVLAVSGIAINFIVIALRGPDTLGVFNQIYAIYIVLSQIGVFGLQHSTLRQISTHFNDRKLCADYVLSALILVVATSLPLIILGMLAANKVGIWFQSPGVSRGLQIAIPGLLFFGMNKVLLKTVNGFRHMRAHAVFAAARYILIFLIIFLAIILNYPDPYLAMALPLTELLLFIGLAGYTFSRLVPFKIPENMSKLANKHLHFGIRSALSNVLLQLNTRVDIIMLGYFLSDEMVGIYSFAAMIAEGFGQLAYAVRYNIDPLIGEYFASGEREKIDDLSRQSRRVALPATTLIGIIAILIYPYLFRLLVSPAMTRSTWPLFAIIMIGAIINSAYRPFSGIFLQGGRPGYQHVVCSKPGHH